jgi:hypothetical protein
VSTAYLVAVASNIVLAFDDTAEPPPCASVLNQWSCCESGDNTGTRDPLRKHLRDNNVISHGACACGVNTQTPPSVPAVDGNTYWIYSMSTRALVKIQPTLINKGYARVCSTLRTESNGPTKALLMLLHERRSTPTEGL